MLIIFFIKIRNENTRMFEEKEKIKGGGKNIKPQ